MDGFIASIVAKKEELDRLRRGAPGGTRNFEHSHDLELTYTSNAIEGNTLTDVETALVIEQAITVAGKPLRPADRPAYVAALPAAQAGGDLAVLDRLL